MAVRIENIKINREGPLESDFQMNAGDLNLIYGRNETGKTYIVEFIIQALFKTGGHSPGKWQLRDWNPRGKVFVSGLKDELVSFTKTGCKLEDFWKEDETGLPMDFSKLLVVKAGESRLSERGDGVGREILKGYLSGEGILDDINSRISRTLRNAEISEHVVNGSDAGEIKNRSELKEKRDEIDKLLKNIDDNYSAGAISSLKNRKAELEAAREEQYNAKRSHAASLDCRLQDLKREMGNVPDNRELSELENKIAVLKSKKQEHEKCSSEKSKLENSSNDCLWTSKSIENYKEILRNQQHAWYGLPWWVITLITGAIAAAMLTTGLLGYTIPFVVSVACALILFFLYNYRMNKSASEKSARAGETEEFERIKAEFKNRFEMELTDQATIESKLEALKKEQTKAEVVDRNLTELDGDLNSREIRISGELRSLTGKELEPSEWQKTIDVLKRERKSLESDIGKIEKQLAALGIREDLYIQGPVAAEWDPDRFNGLVEEISQVEETLNSEERQLETLRGRVAQETGRNPAEGWGDLLTALGEKRDETAKQYRDITAEILAKIQVCSVIDEFRKQENERIKEGLESKEIKDAICQITGRYRDVDLDEEALVLTDQNDDSFTLESMSTGAREQVFLALRIGFASIIMKGNAGFLIFDDAFQHSDWKRRKKLVQQCTSLVEAGWQVFYFTMDDHIKDLFETHGKELKGEFKSVELA